MDTNAPAGSAPPPTSTTSFFQAIRQSGLVRPDERVAAGVAAALAHRWGIDPLLVRVGFVVLSLFGGLSLLAYGAGWLLLPGTDGRVHAEEVMAGRFTPGAVGGLLAVLFGVLSVGPLWITGDGPSIGGLIGLASLVLVVVLFLYAFGVIGRGEGTPAENQPTGTTAAAATTTRARTGRVDLTKPGAPRTTLPEQDWRLLPPQVPHAPQPQHVAPPPRPAEPATPGRRGPGAAATALAAGLALILAGLVVAGRDHLPAQANLQTVVWAAVLGLLALALVVVGLAGRRSGGVGVLAVVAAVTALVHTVAFGAGDARSYDGDVTWAPSGVTASGSQFDLPAGRAVLDLTDLDLGGSADASEINANVSVGQLRVLIPGDLTVELDASVALGDVHGAPEGTSLLGGPGRTDVMLDLDVGVGDMVIEEVSG